MIDFIEGPAHGARLDFQHLAHYLRVVVKPSLDGMAAAAGMVDVLDAPGDTPEPDEEVHIYRLVRHGISAHVLAAGKGSWYHDATFRHMPNVDGELLRDEPAWRAWINGRPNVLPSGAGRPFDEIYTDAGWVPRPV